MTFSLRKLLAVVAVYCVALAVMQPLGATGLVLASILGTATGGIILLAGKKDVGRMGIAAAGCVLGIFVASLLVPVRYSASDAIENGFSDFMILAIGGINGALILSVVAHR